MLHAFFDDADTWAENGHIFLAGYMADDAGWDAIPVRDGRDPPSR
jgi:hypothetical protein